MDAHELTHDDRDDYYDYEVPSDYDADDSSGSVRVTIRAVTAGESADYIDSLFNGRCPRAHHYSPEPPPRPVSAEPAEPISLSDELKKMGLL